MGEKAKNNEKEKKGTFKNKKRLNRYGAPPACAVEMAKGNKKKLTTRNPGPQKRVRPKRRIWQKPIRPLSNPETETEKSRSERGRKKKK